MLAHVYIYNALYRLTNEGTDILRAQCIFMVLYLASLCVVMNCYRMVKVREIPNVVAYLCNITCLRPRAGTALRLPSLDSFEASS